MTSPVSLVETQPASSGAERQKRHRAKVASLERENAELRARLEGSRPRVMNAVTLATAITLPAFALSATLQTGALWTVGAEAKWVTGAIAAAIYLVSLPHVAKGVRAATSISLWAACLLALAIDGAVIAGEVARLSGGVESLAWVQMGVGVVLSMAFNAVGFTASAPCKPAEL